MTSNIKKQLIAIHVLPNISRSKGNQAFKFVQLTEYNMRIFFLKNHAETETGRLVSYFFLFFRRFI